MTDACKKWLGSTPGESTLCTVWQRSSAYLDLLRWQDNQQYLVGSAACFIRDLFMIHVVLVWMYTRVGNAWSPVGARLVAMPLARVYVPLAYTKLEDNKVLALPPAWL